MLAAINTLLIEGTFEELVDELTQYIDNLKRTHGDEKSTLQQECQELIQGNKKDEALKKLVPASAVLNAAPEKEIIAAYNLLLHIVRQSPNVNMYLSRICQHLQKPITSSPASGAGLALTILSTIFNTLAADDEVRYHVFRSILVVIKSTGNFDTLKRQLKHLDSWLVAWETEEEDQRKLYLSISEAAKEAGEEDYAYQYLVKALRTISADEASSDEARQLSLRALKAALVHPSHYDFQDLTALDSVQALRRTDSVYSELLDIFTSENLEEYNDFEDDHPGWIAAEGLDEGALLRKMRLLTLASLAASSGQTRSLPYSKIAQELQIPNSDVEVWVIDVIRAGLVEGKLSQLNQQFLIHRSTYRVFGETQWREVAARLDMWQTSLIGVLDVIRAEKANFITAREQELKEVEAKVNGATGGGRRQQRQAAETDLD